MKQRIIIAFAIFMAVFSLSSAGAFSRLQENLVGLPNRFAVTVADFADDGSFTRQSVHDMVERQLRAAGFTLASENSAPPLATVQVMVVRHDDPSEGKTYMLDLNIYNHSTLNTTYRLRMGTIWVMGSEKVVAGNEFPRDVEGKLSQMLRYLAQDYFAANPNEGGKR